MDRVCGRSLTVALLLVSLVEWHEALPLSGLAQSDKFCQRMLDGNYAYPAPHCSFFYSCSGSITYIMSCPAGLWFNENIDACDWPYSFSEEQQAACRDKIPSTSILSNIPSAIQPAKTEESEAAIAHPIPPVGAYAPSDRFCRRKPDGNYEYPAPNCSLYYSCSNSDTYIMVCNPFGLWYNENLNACDWPSSFSEEKQKECRGQQSSTHSTVPPTTIRSKAIFNPAIPSAIGNSPSNKFCSRMPNGKYEYPAPHCSYYYQCVNRLTFVLRCHPRGTWFDKGTEACRRPSWFSEEKQAACRGQLSSSTSQSTESSSTVSPTTTNDVQSTIQPETTTTTTTTTTTEISKTTTTPVTPPTDTFCQEKPDGNYEYPAPHCSFYYSCSNGRTYIMPCGPGGLWYNKDIDACDWPSSFSEEKQAECTGLQNLSSSASPSSTTSLISSSSISSTTKPTTTAKPDSSKTTYAPVTPDIGLNDTFCRNKPDGNYEYPAPHCSFYYSCSNGYTSIMPCPSGLWYNKDIDACDWPSSFPDETQAACRGLLSSSASPLSTTASASSSSESTSGDTQ